MDPLQSKLNLEADLERIAGVIMEYGWTIDPWPITDTTIIVTMMSVVDKEKYYLLLACDDYPEKPPSIRCVKQGTRDPNDAKAWPNCEGFRPPPTADLCLTVSREGLMQIHPDWSRDTRYAWTRTGNPIWYALSSLQDRLNDPTKYHGRQG
jgi:hypothetical protein